MKSDTPVLSIRHLQTWFYLNQQIVKAVDDISLDIYRGRITALVGSSGSGKSVTALSIFNLIEKPGRIVGGEIWLNGSNLLTLPEPQLRQIRGRELAMIFQEPAAALNPTLKIHQLLDEVLRIHGRQQSDVPVRTRFIDVLSRAGLPNPKDILNRYPFELSGGMCQRVMVAMGLLAQADVLIADEPTASLDLTTQVGILQQLVELRNAGMAIVLITHDLGVVAQTADDIYVMHEGKIVEYGSVFEIFEAPQHPYTHELIACIDPELEHAAD